MLDLKEKSKLDQAKQILQSLESDIQQKILGGSSGDLKPVKITLKGLNTFKRGNQPAKMSNLLFTDVQRDAHFDKMKQISSHVIQAFVSAGFDEGLRD